MLDQSHQQNPDGATCYFLQRIDHGPVAIGCQRLRDLEECCAAKNDAAYEQQAARVGEGKECSEESERDNVLEAGVGLHLRPHQEGRKFEIDRVDEAYARQGGVGDRNDGEPCRRRNQPLEALSMHGALVQLRWTQRE